MNYIEDFFKPSYLNLNEDQRKIYDILNDNSFLGNIKKQKLYLTHNKDEIQKVTGYIISGGLIGGTVGFIFSNLTDNIWKKTICISGGVVIGSVVSTINCEREIRKSTKFVDWKIKAITEEFYKAYSDFIEEDNDLLGFKCVISNDLIVDPVVDPHGHVYERASIYEYISRNGGKVECPHQSGEIEEKDLKDDVNYKYLVCSRIHTIFENEINEQVKSGLWSFIMACQQNNKQWYFKEHEKNDFRYQSGFINFEEFKKKKKKIDEIYELNLHRTIGEKENHLNYE